MLKTKLKSIYKYPTIFVLAFLFYFLLFNHSCFAVTLSEPKLDVFAQNNILFYDPSCISKGGLNMNSCFKIDSNTAANDFWYAEGCLNNGTCTSGTYASTTYTSGGHNDFLLNDTETDNELGGMQYIYAENYDIEYGGYEGWIAKFTKKAGANSTRKYYWIVLPDQAYSTGFGETYIATFENLSDPVYLITYDVHACPHQSEDYCGKAKADPDGVKIGKEFLGALTKNGGNYTEVSKITGKLTSLCRIDGQGDVTASESPSNITTTSKSPNSSNSNSSDVISGSNITWIGDSYSVGARSIIEGKFSGIEFGGSVNDDNSYIQGCRNVATDTDCNANPKKNPAALKVLERIINDGKIKPYLVMAVGTNEGWSDSSIATLEQLMSKAPDTNVILVTSKTTNSNYTESNERLKTLASTNDRYYLADWAAVADSSYFASDKVHPTSNGGYEKWVEVISNTLANINNCTTHVDDYPQYFQNDYENSDHEKSDQDWSQMSYFGSTINRSGCGPTSMAMLTTVATGKDVYPQDIVEVTKSAGSYTGTQRPAGSKADGGGGQDLLVGEAYGLEVVEVTFSGYEDAENKMREYLKNGYLLHISGAGGMPFTNGGHYVGIFKINDDDETVLVADSYKNGDHVGNIEMKLHDVVHAGIHGSISAIKGNGGNGPCNDNLCPDSNTTSVAENLTEEQAQKLADYYNSDKVSASEWELPHGKNNCFSFSKWFTNALTSIGKTSVSGNGRDFAHNIAAIGNLEEGTVPRPYAVFSTTKTQTLCGGIPCGHTGIVVAVNDDDIITVEAMYPSTPAEVHHRSADYFVNTAYNNVFAYLDTVLNKTQLGEIIGN